jgi:hypothetical protein
LWRSSLNSVVQAKKSKVRLRRFFSPVLQMKNANILKPIDVDRIRGMCLNNSLCSDRKIQDKIKSILHDRAPEHRKQNLHQRADRQAARAKVAGQTFKAKIITSALDLTSPTSVTSVSDLLIAEEDLIGLHKTKLYAQSLVSDTIGRFRLQEPISSRHIAIIGAFGSGKQTSARFIASWRTLLKRSSKFPKPKGDVGAASPSASTGGVPSWAVKGRFVTLIDNSIDDSSSGPLSLGQTAKIEQVAKTYVKIKNWSYKFSCLKPHHPEDLTRVSSIEELQETLEAFVDFPSPTIYLRLSEPPKTTDEVMELNNSLLQNDTTTIGRAHV